MKWGCISGIAQKTVANVAHIFYNIKYIWGPYERILCDIREKTQRSLVNVEMILGGIKTQGWWHKLWKTKRRKH